MTPMAIKMARRIMGRVEVAEGIGKRRKNALQSYAEAGRPILEKDAKTVHWRFLPRDFAEIFAEFSLAEKTARFTFAVPFGES